MDGKTLHEKAQEFALTLPFSEPAWPFGPEYDVFTVEGKIFMIKMSLRGEHIVNLKVDPEQSLLHQAIYPHIKPGYHMNKKHWISVYPGDEITVELLNSLIEDSWNLVVNKLPKRVQQRVRPV
ncbi:TPA: MmcQ/YjbR family DNA-binding protein [Kluyvera georgiana]|uniref:MmcQ/YjbR family DNA-binding protein n=1 Tax=Kluyvera genomosp. 3 TaxID=2774055 RepID=A0A6G9RNG5_9ENTR|nr:MULTISPECIES: MmcQ/YjbR family DNA-binding protein [Kluyvera]QIR28460.1 MmcQ/YjbR family DNA-binding protein [Kluyvera genomosp. 3]